MKAYTYFPGCCCDEGTGVASGISARAIAGPLEIELRELADWSCCGSAPMWALDSLEGPCASLRNLALAEPLGLDLVTQCSACYLTLKKAHDVFLKDPAQGAHLGRALRAAGLEYRGRVRIRHLAEVLLDDVGDEAIARRVQKKLSGLRVACYYGCQTVRPRGIDHPEFPVRLEALVTTLGAEAVDFPYKTRCCGASLMFSEQDLALSLVRKILESATERGAQCLVTVCPFCQINLDAFQRQINSRFGTRFQVPVLFLTQLIGLALGLEPRALALEKNVVSPGRLLSPLVA
ncbi:MAG: CoB--CoM heterodisulfide reductase iron-sulfur subunit B family protein [Bacillota bacterium]|nr:CoB--CoM heterodisulfide reductase iron-sulfur subunit B family protein [Bacillota bacterium]